MRSKLNLDTSANRRDEKLAISGLPLSTMPLEWLDAGSWRLPSGKALAEFALQAGFIAPLLLKVEKADAASSAGHVSSRLKRFGKRSGA